MPTPEFNKEGTVYRIAATPVVEAEELGDGRFAQVEKVEFTHLDQ